MDSSQRLGAARMKALGHPVRLGIVQRLAREPETCACDFAEVFRVSQPTVSQHLRVLREAGLVASHPAGRQRIYEIRPEGFAALARWLTPYVVLWQAERDAAAGR
jgi:DNA-binding transcriptional ArsR family regulator